MNMTLDELKARAKADLDNAFEKGKSHGGIDETQLPQYYMTSITAWNSAKFPDGYNFKLSVRDVPESMTSIFMYASGVKTVTLTCEGTGTTSWLQVLRGCTSVEVFDVTNFKVFPTTIRHFANNAKSLVSIIGEIDMSNCTNAGSAFYLAQALKDIRFKEGTISIALDFHWSTKLSAESLHSILMGLSPTVTGQTLTLPKYETCKATYNAVYGDGSFDIIVASKTNWTIAYS